MREGSDMTPDEYAAYRLEMAELGAFPQRFFLGDSTLPEVGDVLPVMDSDTGVTYYQMRVTDKVTKDGTTTLTFTYHFDVPEIPTA